MPNLHEIEAEVLGTIRDGYRLKVSVHDLGLFMYGWTARPSERSANGWWIQPQAFPVRGTLKNVPEFDKKMPLWKELEAACIAAVLKHEPVDAEVDMSQEALKRNLDEAAKKYGL